MGGRHDEKLCQSHSCLGVSVVRSVCGVHLAYRYWLPGEHAVQLRKEIIT